MFALDSLYVGIGRIILLYEIKVMMAGFRSGGFMIDIYPRETIKAHFFVKLIYMGLCVKGEITIFDDDVPFQ